MHRLSLYVNSTSILKCKTFLNTIEYCVICQKTTEPMKGHAGFIFKISNKIINISCPHKIIRCRQKYNVFTR